MVSRKIKLNVLEVNQNTAKLRVELGGKRESFSVKIVDNHGLFGVEYPPKLGLMLHEFPKESKELVGTLRKESQKTRRAA